MPVEERVGDLFSTTIPALAHGCNCAGAMGRGIAVEFRRRWPAMYEEYRELCRSGRFQPGDVFPWVEGDVTVFNLGTQRTWRTKATLDAITRSVSTMAGLAAERGLTEVALPRIGAGLGGLDWPDVRAVLEQSAGADLSLVVHRP